MPREGLLQFIPEAALGYVDFAFQHEEAAVVKGGHGRDAEHIGDGARRTPDGLIGLIEKSFGRSPVDGETLEPMQAGEEGILQQGSLRRGPEKSRGVIVGKGLEAVIVGDGLGGKVCRDVEALPGFPTGQVIFEDILVLFRGDVEFREGGDEGDAFTVPLLAFRGGRAGRRDFFARVGARRAGACRRRRRRRSDEEVSFIVGCS